MIAFLVWQALALGHYTTVDVSDPAVKHVENFVTTKLPLLFPEGVETAEILSAERQTVAGYNLKLTVQLRQNIQVTVTLWVNVHQQIQLTSFGPVQSGRKLAGGWRWEPVDSFTEEDKKSLKTLIAEQNGFGGDISSIFAVRYQTVAGRNQHVIFSDTDGALHSVVVYTNIEQETSVTFFRTVEQA
jgi:hypothetical protein